MTDLDAGPGPGPGGASPSDELDQLFPESERVLHVDPPTTGPDDTPSPTGLGPADAAAGGSGEPGTGPEGPAAAGPGAAGPGAAGQAIIRLQLTHMGIVLGATLLIAAIGFFLLGNAADDGLSIAYPILLVGGLGGTATTVRRVQQLARADVVTLEQVPRSLAVAQIYLSTIIGAGFALLLYLVFLGGMLQGEFFPAFACGAEPFTSYGAFSLCNPATNADAALALVWGFVAGFAERFVPSLLDRFVDDGDGGANGGSDGAARASA